MKDNIKTAIITALSVVIAIYLGEFLKIKSLFYSSIAAAIVSQVSYKEVFKLGVKRISGTLFGAVTGFLFYRFTPDSIIDFPIGILIITIASSIYKNISSNIACIVFLAVLTNLKGAPPETYALHRVADTAVGVVAALIVSYIFKIAEERLSAMFFS